MKKKYFHALVSIVLFSLVLVGCAKDENVLLNKGQGEKDSLVMAIGSEPGSGFDPCTGWGRYGNPLFQSTLIDTDENMEIVYDLAKDYEISNDGLRWKFIIRDDAYFTDGERVTANDVAFTFGTAKSSGSIVDLTNMKEVIAIYENTVEFLLEKPDTSFIYTVAATGIVPKHAYGDDYGDNPIGSGPFVLIQWDKGQQIIMTANEDYYGKVPEIKKVTILFMDEDAAFAAAKAGEIDVAMTNPNFADQEISGMKLITLESIDNRGLTLPYLKDEGKTDASGNRIGNNVTSDIAVRRALSYGINRDSIVSDVINGYGRPAFTECDGMPWSNEEAIVEFDLQKAKNILDEAGWIDTNNDGIREKDGAKAEFNLLYSSSDITRQSLATAFSLQAEGLGIKITTEGTSWDVIDRRMFSEAVLMGWGAQNPMETYLLYHSDNMSKDYYNPEYFSNTTVDEYIDKAMGANDLSKSMEFWKKAQWDGTTGISTKGECAWIWLVNLDHLYYLREGLNIGEQKIHPHGHAWPVISNLKDWTWD